MHNNPHKVSMDWEQDPHWEIGQEFRLVKAKPDGEVLEARFVRVMAKHVHLFSEQPPIVYELEDAFEFPAWSDREVPVMRLDS
jgi:hypothetical protein